NVKSASGWTTIADVPAADSPMLTNGPGGTFLLFKKEDDAASQRQYWASQIVGSTINPPQPTGQREATGYFVGMFADAVEDPATGRLHFVHWNTDLNGNFSSGISYATSPDGATWSAGLDVAPGAMQHDNGSAFYPVVRVAEATGDEGFTGLVVYDQGAGDPDTGDAPIDVARVPGPPEPPPPPPPPAGTGTPPPAGTEAPPSPSPGTPAQPSVCQVLQFGALDVVAEG